MKKISLFDVPDADERGVSPVIGVILMVAITVILAAVIATFVLGFPDQVSQNVNAGADVNDHNDGTATVTWISEGNAVELNVTTTDGDLDPEDGNISSVGESVIVENISDSATITVTAIGEGGTETVITQEEVTNSSS